MASFCWLPKCFRSRMASFCCFPLRTFGGCGRAFISFMKCPFVTPYPIRSSGTPSFHASSSPDSCFLLRLRNTSGTSSGSDDKDGLWTSVDPIDVNVPARRRSIEKSEAARRVSAMSTRGTRSVNQDDFFVKWKGNAVAVGVLDGHGSGGEDVVAKAKAHMLDALDAAPHWDNPSAILLSANEQLKATDSRLLTSAGTTATLGIVEFLASRIRVAHVGDSRAIVCLGDGAVKQLTRDHDTSSPEERARIRAKGGQLDFATESYICLGERMISLTRAFGDLPFQRVGLLEKPEETEFVFDDKARFLVLASDGLWHSGLSNEEVTVSAEATVDAEGLTRFLVKSARDRWHREAIGGYTDDVTVATIDLSPP